jgi:hypothetical protein
MDEELGPISDMRITADAGLTGLVGAAGSAAPNQQVDRQAATSQTNIGAQNTSPNSGMASPQPPAAPAATSPKVGEAQMGYIDPFGPGGVSRAPSAAAPSPFDPQPSVLASPLIPAQPLPPGAPAALAGAMGAPSTPSPELSTGQDSHTESRDGIPSIEVKIPPAKPASPKVKEDKGRFGPNPLKPTTHAAIAEFVDLWHSPSVTVPQLAERYHCTENTIRAWRDEFGLPSRPKSKAAALEAGKIMGMALSGRPVDPALDAAVVGNPNVKAPAGPLDDPEIVALLADITTESRMITTHSDLTPLQRKLAKLNVMATSKAPLQSWASVVSHSDAMSRAVLNMRRVEAEIPRGDADPIQLRKEAAGQMMRELRSVLTPEEQQTLATIVKAGADRLIAKGASADSITAGDEGTDEQ